MKTLDLKEAASFLKIPEGLRRKVARRNSSAKPGKRWCFCEEDLVGYLKSLYANPAKTSWGVVDANWRNNIWHSTKEEKCGGSSLATMEKEYNKALGLPTE